MRVLQKPVPAPQKFKVPDAGICRLPALRRIALATLALALGGAPLLGAQISGDSQGSCTDPLFCRDTTTATPQTDLPSSTYQDRSSSPNSPADQRSRELTNNNVYVDRAGSDANNTRQNDLRNSRNGLFAPDPVTDMQRLAKTATGEMLPVFGRDLFQMVPSTFAPGDQLAVTSDYVIGPGDDILLRLWGPETFNSQLTVDRSGAIYIPKVGAIHVAGLRFDQLQPQITAELGHSYRNFNVSVSVGRLRSIQVYVVGEARRPGAYTVSSLSTVLNALFASGGPNVQGSMRHIQIRRGGQTLPEFDLYDLVLRGDKSKDARLENGDTIFIPAVGPQVALGGSVRHPGIYELKGDSTVQDMLDLAGGFSPTASGTQISLERIQADQVRHAMTVMLDAAGRGMTLRDGDVLYTGHISPGYEQSVTIRGNLANPGRFAWHEGMRLSDIIPDRRSLLTNNYWKERNQLGVPVPLFEPLPQNRRSTVPNTLRRGTDGRNATQGTRLSLNDPLLTNDQSSRTDSSDDPSQQDEQNQLDAPIPTSAAGQAALAGERLANGTEDNGYTNNSDTNNSYGDTNDSYGQQSSNSVMAAPGTLSQQQQSQQQRNSDGTPRTPQNKIRIPAPEIDWSYAVIERLDPITLKNVLVPFKPGRLVQDHDPAQNLELRAGDIVTILSQNDIPVPQDEQTKYVRLEGEFVASGVYSVSPGETLGDLVQRAGGFTSKAYLYGSNFKRESARAFQQQRLDEYISELSTDMERSAAVRTASSATGIADPTALAEQRSLIAHLRQLRATGRVVLEFRPNSSGADTVPKIPLENGDVFRVPTRPNTISVIGAVYGQNVFLYDAQRRLSDYVALAGKPNRIADRKHAFIIRADGSIFSRERAQRTFSNSFDEARINPGDSIVIPEKLIKPTALRQLIDYSQILSSFGLAAAAINVVR